MHNKPADDGIGTLNALYLYHALDCIKVSQKKKCCGKYTFLIRASEQREGQRKGRVTEKCIRGSINVTHTEGWGDKEGTGRMCSTNAGLISICLVLCPSLQVLFYILLWTAAMSWGTPLRSIMKCVCVHECVVSMLAWLLSLPLTKAGGSWMTWASCAS